jgi:hypothetical protein
VDPEHHFATWSIGPRCDGNGWALLGELRKFVAVSPNRITSVQCDEDEEVGGGGLSVKLSGGPKEAVELLFASPGPAGDHKKSSGPLKEVKTVLDATGQATVRCSVAVGALRCGARLGRLVSPRFGADNADIKPLSSDSEEAWTIELPTHAKTDDVPHWVGPRPDPTVVGAGLPRLKNTRRVTVYNSSLPDGGPNPAGLYNHGPMVIYADGALDVDNTLKNRFICCWYNGPKVEGHGNRVVLATSPNAEVWSVTT